jgi:hypothetical protein
MLPDVLQPAREQDAKSPFVSRLDPVEAAQLLFVKLEGQVSPAFGSSGELGGGALGRDEPQLATSNS